MALTLAESAKLSQDQLAAGVMETFAFESPVLGRLPFMEIEGNAYRYTTENALPGVAFRAVNAGYTESTGTFAQATESLVIVGGDADVDKFIVQTRGNLNDQRAIQTRMKTKALAIKWTETFFEGDTGVDANSFNGLRTRLTGAQVIAAGANGAALTLAMLDDLISLVDGQPDALFMDRWLRRKVASLMRAAGYYEPESTDEFNRPIGMYAGIPMVEAGLSADGSTSILGFDETQGSSSVTASIYAVRFGEEEWVAGLQNGVPQVYDLGELETKPSFRTRIEWYCGLGIFRTKAAARLKGITQA